MASGDEDAASLLDTAESGDGAALDRLFELLYRDLRAIAAGYLRQERPGHTLQPTALVHEAYLKLVRGRGAGPPRGRSRFLALAARAMRRALVDHARGRGRIKRGAGEWVRVTLDPEAGPVGGGESREIDVLALDAALEKLETLHERQARVVELRAFSGLTIAEAAEVLGVSHGTVEDDWAMARTWLWLELDRR